MYKFLNKCNTEYNRVIIYGYGTIGTHVYKHLNNVVGVIDKNNSHSDINYVTLEDLHNINFDAIIVTLLEKHAQESIVNILKTKYNIDADKILILSQLANIDKNKFFFKEHANLTNKLATNSNPLEKLLNVQIQTISHCNAKCYFCPYHDSWHQQNPGRMEDEVFKKIVNSLKTHKINKFCPYLENEPILDVNLFERVFYAVDVLKPNIVEIATNLSILNDNTLNGFAKLSQFNHEIRISFHGISEDSYRDVMQLEFLKTLENVKTLVKFSQTTPLNITIRGAGKPRVNSPEVKYWFGEEEYYNFWKNELKEFAIKPKIEFFTYHDRAGQKQLKEKGMTFNIYREELKDFYCQRLDSWVHFLYTGEPILCCMDYNKETAFGESIKNTNFDDLYTSEKYLSMLKKATGLVESSESFICKRCISPGG